MRTVGSGFVPVNRLKNRDPLPQVVARFPPKQPLVTGPTGPVAESVLVDKLKTYSKIKENRSQKSILVLKLTYCKFQWTDRIS